MGEPGLEQFDFDQWAALAEADPVAFERHRAETIDRAIRRAAPRRRQRLRGLQWRIDTVRRQARTPLAACIRLSDMMWASVLGPEGLLERLEGGRQAPARPCGGCRVIPFPAGLREDKDLS
ncbi:MAG: DUF3135 domain-containing protein [Gammaproteobacteria bacterium]|nr:DUF3135 domain-containing protein [Gammaproteobacteria bacterium]NIR59136.1 DUF3135 domain-containing protein [Gammaproteobacteria bacterium]